MSVTPFLGTGPHRLFGVRSMERGAGTAVAGSMRTGRWCTGADGRPAVGALGVLVDEVLGYSIIASMPPGGWSVSTEIWVDLLAPLPADGSSLHSSADVVVPRSFASGTVVDEGGRVLAQVRERGWRVPGGPDDRPPRPGGEPVAAVPDAGGDPVGPVGPVDGADPADLAGLVGLRRRGDRFVLDVADELLNPVGALHGGISLAASEAVATWSRVLAGSDLPTCSVHIVHTRPVPAGARLELRASTRHAGRSLWLTDVEATVDGTVCASTRVTAQG